MTDKNKNLLKSILLLFGSFLFGRFFATFLHEHGHAVAAWTTGVKVYRIVFHPLNWSFISLGSRGEYGNFITWSGSLFAVFVGLLMVIIVWRWRRPSLMPILMTAVVACTKDGAYLIISSLFNTRGDGAALVERGTPLIIVIAVGFVIFTIGISLAFTCLNLLGIGTGNKIKSRILIFGAGIFPYLIAMLIYHLRYMEELNIWLIRIFGSIALVSSFAVLSGFVQRSVQWLRNAETKTVTWLAVIKVNIVGFILILFMFFVLPNFPPIETRHDQIITYYDNESNFAGTFIKEQKLSKKNLYRNYKNEYTVFWSISGIENKVKIPFYPYFAVASSNKSEVIVFTDEGVLITPLDDKPYYWLYKHKEIYSMPGDKVNKNRTKALLYGFEVSDSDEYRDVLIGLDLSSGYAKKIQVDGGCFQKQFIGNNTALVVMGQSPSEMTHQSSSEEGTLIKVEFSESGDISYTPLSGENTKDILRGALKGKPVFYLDEEKYGLRYGNQKIIFTKPIRYIQASESHIWVVDYEGQIFKVKPDGSKTCLDTCDVESIIGCGTFDDNLWIAFSDGIVKTFGAGDSINTSITLP